MVTIEQGLAAEQPCKPQACAIQNCLTKNNYNEARCTAAIFALYECCAAFYQKNGDHATSLSCPQAEILRQRMETMKR